MNRRRRSTGSLVSVLIAISAVLACSSTAGAWPAGWTGSLKIHSTHGLDEEDVSLAVTADGRAHVAISPYEGDFGEQGLFYTSETGTRIWTSEQVTTKYDASPSLVVDADGTVTIAFERFAPDDLSNPIGIYIASKVGGTWSIKRIYHGYAYSPSLQRLNGHDYLAFYGPTSQVYYATNALGTWHFSRFGTHCCGPQVFLRMAPDGTPRIAWEDSPAGPPYGARYSLKVNGHWHTTSLGSTLGSMAFVLVGDRPYIAFGSGGRPLLRSLVNGHWSKTSIGPSGYVPIDMTVDASGTAKVLITDQSTVKLVTIASAIGSQTLTDISDGSFAARMVEFGGKLDIVYDRNLPASRRGVWFRRQT
jgi:hypothetical protein